MRISRCWHACSAAAQQALHAQQVLHAQHAPHAQQAREAAAAAAAGVLHSRAGEAAAAAGRWRQAVGIGQRRQQQLTGMRPLWPTGAAARACVCWRASMALLLPSVPSFRPFHLPSP